MMPLNIPLANVDEADPYKPFPAGPQNLIVVGADVRPNKANTGTLVAAEFAVTDGDQKGRRVFENFNVQNQNPDAVEIGLRMIKQLIIACGGSGSENLTAELIAGLAGREFTGDVYVEKGNNGYNDANKIKAFSPKSGAIAPATPQPAAAGDFNDDIPAAFSASNTPPPPAQADPWAGK